MEELILEKLLLRSGNKVYSSEIVDIKNETKMTSNTTPAPLIVSASSEYSATYQAWKAFNGTKDGGSYDYWSSVAGTTGWIQINYGKKTYANILELSATQLNQSVANGLPRDFDILASNDGTNFVRLAEFRSQTWTNGETKVFNFNNNSAYQYYRIEAFSTNGYGYVCVGEILFAAKIDKVVVLPSLNKSLFIDYGNDVLEKLDTSYMSMDYVLRNTISENQDGLWTTKIDRKPLSISFK